MNTTEDMVLKDMIADRVKAAAKLVEMYGDIERLSGASGYYADVVALACAALIKSN